MRIKSSWRPMVAEFWPIQSWRLGGHLAILARVLRGAESGVAEFGPDGPMNAK